MDESSLKDFVERAQSIIDNSPQMDEANTKAAILQDFLKLLDWDIPLNTQLEYSVTIGTRTYKIDYALVLEGTPVAFFEAKGLDTALTGDEDEQLASYMKNENVNYGILSNGREYRFYQRRVDASNVSVDVVAEIPLNKLPVRHKVVRAFTKDAIQSGESGKILGRINELRRARATLEEDKDDLADNVTRLFSNEVSDAISSPVESQAKEMIDRLIQDIGNEIDSDSRPRPGPRGSPGQGASGRTPEPNSNAIVGTIKRRDIPGEDDASVVIFPSKKSGVDFLRENNAWGFVRIGQEPDFIAMYVSEEIQQVKYIAKVSEIVDPEDADLARPLDSYYESGSDQAQAGFDPEKKVILFEDDSLYELEEPIEFNEKWPQSLRYTTLDELKAAETTADIL